MNRMTRDRRARILHLLCEGNSIRAVTRLTGASKKAVSKLMVDAGQAAGHPVRPDGPGSPTVHCGHSAQARPAAGHPGRGDPGGHHARRAAGADHARAGGGGGGRGRDPAAGDHRGGVGRRAVLSA